MSSKKPLILKEVFSLNKNIVYFESFSLIRLLTPSNEESRFCEIEEISKSLVIKPGFYYFQKEVYDCRVPGVYRFLNPDKENLQRVVLEPGNSLNNIIALSLVSVRGNSDNLKSQEEKLNLACSDFVHLTCTYNCMFLLDILYEEGFDARLVQGHTLENLNSYNNGHSLLETYSGKDNKYVVIDVDKKCIFKRDNTILNLFEVAELLSRNQSLEIINFSNAQMFSYSFTDIKSNYTYSFLEHFNYSSESGIYDVIKRTCQIPLLKKDGKTYASYRNESDIVTISKINPNWILTDSITFRKLFY